MSTRWITPKATLRQTQLKWMNFIVHTHDLFCDCPKPVEHTAAFIFQQEQNLQFTPPEKDIIKKCLGGEPATPAGDVHEEDDFGPGDLDVLFGEDFGEDTDTG